ncbi:MAG: hypothetical protein IH905_00435 [Proteobacteria bacterium]|nr:hypothetical protein [Pseudomonadota bacterium]
MHTLLPRSPELNPVENNWQFTGVNWPSKRVYSSHDDIFDGVATLGTSWSLTHGKISRS